MFPSTLSLFQATLLLFLYDNLDLMATFSYMKEANFSYLGDRAFWTYFGSRVFIMSVMWLLLVSQDPPLFAGDLTMGLAIFFIQIGVIPNFTVRIGSYDLRAFKKFSIDRETIIQNMKDRIGLERARQNQEISVELEEFSLGDLKKHLYRAYAATEVPLEQAQQEIQDFRRRLGQHEATEEVEKPYYAAEIIRVGGPEFARGLISNKELRKQDTRDRHSESEG